MAMQCEEKPRLLRKIQVQALADELQKAEYLMEEVCKEVGSGYHVRYFTRVTVSIIGPMEQQHKRLATIVAAALRLYEFYTR